MISQWPPSLPRALRGKQSASIVPFIDSHEARPGVSIADYKGMVVLVLSRYVGGWVNVAVLKLVVLRMLIQILQCS